MDKSTPAIVEKKGKSTVYRCGKKAHPVKIKDEKKQVKESDDGTQK